MESAMRNYLEHWQAMSAMERETAARGLVLKLPSGFAFDSIVSCRVGNQVNEVAMFRFEGARFALIPGGTVSIGFDADRRWSPSSDELESWQATSEEYGIDKAIQEYIREATLRRRQVELAPFLIETEARELGWETISLDDPIVRDILKEHGREGTWTRQAGGSEECAGVSTRVRRHDGHIVAERSVNQTHSDLAERLRASGFRFPTSDEWEYACGSGEQALFRWGDHIPCDRYPTDISPPEARWRKDWVLSGGKLEYPDEGFAPDWDLHRKPNAFGLHIAADPYKSELTAEVGTTRGGDRGGTICGGMGFFVGWLTLATAYFEEHACKHDPAEAVDPAYTVGRRVLSLP
jgi:hypothetical protein